MYKGIDENDVAHYIDEEITYRYGEEFGYDDCWLFKCGALSNCSKALRGLDNIEKEIGVGILKEIKNRAFERINIYNCTYFVVKVDDVIDVYDNYVHKGGAT